MFGKAVCLSATFRILALAVVIFPAGCNMDSAPGPAPVYRKIPVLTIKSVDWYFDATPSMEGYVSSKAAGPSYRNFIMLLEQSLDTLYRPLKVPIQLHRFGTHTETFLNSGDTFSTSFYKSGEGYKDTDLRIVGESIKQDGLTIVTTDLFQTDDHIETFRAALLDKGLGRDFQFGLLALQAGFDGMLYDIPPSHGSMSYAGRHPVYAIVLGPQQQVREFISDVLHRDGEGLPQGQIQGALLSSELATPKVALRDLKIKGPSGANAESYFLPTELDAANDSEKAMIDEGDASPAFVRPLGLAHVASHPTVVYQTALQFEPFEVVPVNPASVDAWDLSSNVHVCAPLHTGLIDRIKHAFSRETGPPANAPVQATTGDASVAAEKRGQPTRPDPCPVRNAELLNDDATKKIVPVPGGILTTITLDLGDASDRTKPLKARANYTYVVNLKLVPRTNKYQFPSWVNDFSQPAGAAYAGRWTPNLANFLTTMNQSIAQGGSPAALDDYLYIQSN